MASPKWERTGLQLTVVLAVLQVGAQQGRAFFTALLLAEGGSILQPSPAARAPSHRLGLNSIECMGQPPPPQKAVVPC